MKPVTPVVTTYAEYLYPGMVVSESSASEVPARDPGRIAREAPPKVLAFRFFDQVSAIVILDGQKIKLRSSPLRQSGYYYIDAACLTRADIERLPGDHGILLDNMRYGNWDQVMRCRNGSFRQPHDGDTIISSTGREA